MGSPGKHSLFGHSLYRKVYELQRSERHMKLVFGSSVAFPHVDL